MCFAEAASGGCHYDNVASFVVVVLETYARPAVAAVLETYARPVVVVVLETYASPAAQPQPRAFGCVLLSCAACWVQLPVADELRKAVCKTAWAPAHN